MLDVIAWKVLLTWICCCWSPAGRTNCFAFNKKNEIRKIDYYERWFLANVADMNKKMIEILRKKKQRDKNQFEFPYFYLCVFFAFQMAGNFPDRLDPALPDFVVDPLVLTLFWLLLESLRPNGACFLGPLLASTSILPVFKKVSMPLAWLLRRLEELDLLEELFLREDPLASGGSGWACEGCTGFATSAGTSSEATAVSDTPFSRVVFFSLASVISSTLLLSSSSTAFTSSVSAFVMSVFSPPSSLVCDVSALGGSKIKRDILAGRLHIA